MVVGTPFLIIGLGLVVVAYTYAIRLYLKTKQELEKTIEEAKLAEEKIRKESLEASRNTIRGQVSEEFVPLFGNFPYNMSDCKFHSAPIDYIVYNGMSAGRQDSGGELEILFVEVKTNNAKLSATQRQIAEAIKKGRVYFEEWRIKDGELKIKRRTSENT